MQEEQTNNQTVEPVENRHVEKTIEIVVGGKPRKVKVLETYIDWEGKQEKVIIKKLTYGQRADFTENFVNIQVIGDIPKTTVHMKEMMLQTLMLCLHEAPFPVTLDYITHELDGETGEEIFTLCDRFNKLNPATKKISAGL